MGLKSAPTRGRTLDHAAFVYDLFEPILLLGKQSEYDKHILSLLELESADRVLDLGCGTGVLTRMIADRLDSKLGGASVGIDAAAKMIRVAEKKRGRVNCRFEVMAAEDLSFDDQSFDAAVSSLFFHHVPLDDRGLQARPAVLQVHVDRVRAVANAGKVIARNLRVATYGVDALAAVPKRGIRHPDFSVEAANRRIRDEFKHAIGKDQVNLPAFHRDLARHVLEPAKLENPRT